MVEIGDLSNESIKLLLVLTIVVLGIAVGIIGYFMSKRDEAITRATDNLTKNTDNITKVVEQLQIIVNGVQLQYQIRQPIIDEQLKNHLSYIESNKKDIEELDKRVNTLETEHNMIRCNYNFEKNKKAKP